MKIKYLVLAVAIATKSLLAEPTCSRMTAKFLDSDYDITRLTFVEEGRTQARAYIFAPAHLVDSVTFDTEARRLRDSDTKGRGLPRPPGYIWKVEAAKHTLAVYDGTLLFIERVGESWRVSHFVLGNADLSDTELVAAVESFRKKVANAVQDKPNQPVPTPTAVTTLASHESRQP